MKVLHVFWVNEKRFCKRTVLISNKVGKDSSFLVFDKDQFAFLNDERALLFESKKQSRQVSYVNTLFDRFDFVFFHGLCSPIHFLKIKTKYLCRIVWRTWGGDVGYLLHDGTIKRIIKSLINRCFFKKINKIALIGYANSVDLYNLSQHNLSVKMLPMPYSIDDKFSLLKAEELSSTSSDGILRILVGHSGHLEDNHLIILEKLSHLKGKGIQIIIPINYGNLDYIRLIKQKANDCFSKTEILLLEKPMSFDEYSHLIHNIDVAILDGTISYALGNISLLLFFKKKIFLNRNGILSKVFKDNNIPFFDTDNIRSMNVTDFKKPTVYDNSKIDDLVVAPYDLCVKRIDGIKAYLHGIFHNKHS